MAILGKFGSSGTVDKILSIGDIDAPKAQSALSKLESNKPDATKYILQQLATGPKIHHRLLLKLLAKMLTNTTVPLLMEGLGELHTDTRDEVVSLLNKSHDFDPHLLLPYLKNPLPIAICRNLVMAHRKRFTAQQMLRSIGKIDSELWETIFELIYALADETIIPDAVATSHSKNPVMRAYVTDLIAEFGGPVASEALQHLAFDEDSAVRQKAITGLSRRKANIPAKDLFRLLQSSDGQELALVKTLLKSCKDPDIGKHLLKTLLSKNHNLIDILKESLKDIVNENIIRDILQGLEGRDSWVREDAIKVLAESAGDQYLAAVGKLAKDADDSIRAIALEALEQGDISNPEVLDALRESLNTDDFLTRSNAIRRLGEAKDTESVDKLLSLITKDPQSSSSVLEALGNIGDARALPNVFDLLNSSDIKSQRAALQCLPKIITKKYAESIRDQLISHADKLHVAVGQTLIETLELITADFELNRDSKYNDSLRSIVTQLSADKEQLVEPAQREVANSDPVMSLEAEMKLGDRYQLIREIGRGGYGAVWLVKDTIIDEELVMKFLHEALVSDGIAVERFIRELRFARKVTHQNIIRLHDYLNLGNVSAISMEYFDGLPLTKEIEAGVFDIFRMTKIIKTICSALAAAHEVDVVHRDLKPANILLNEEDVIKIVDFGIAAASKHAESKLTRTGTLVGTPTYISPEQIQGKTVDGRTDIYSLGIIMYEMLSGDPPYTADDPMALVFQHVEGCARRLEEVNPLVPQVLADLVHKCIAPTPDERFQSMLDLSRAFEELEIE